MVGQPLAQAKGRLWESGLNVGRIDFDEGINLLNQKEARVYIQIPGAEHSASLGSRIDLRLTLDMEKLGKYRSEAEKLAAQAAEARKAEAEAVRFAMEQEADSLARISLDETLEGPREADRTRENDDNEGFFD